MAGRVSDNCILLHLPLRYQLWIAQRIRLAFAWQSIICLDSSWWIIVLLEVKITRLKHYIFVASVSSPIINAVGSIFHRSIDILSFDSSWVAKIQSTPLLIKTVSGILYRFQSQACSTGLHHGFRSHWERLWSWRSISILIHIACIIMGSHHGFQSQAKFNSEILYQVWSTCIHWRIW